MVLLCMFVLFLNNFYAVSTSVTEADVDQIVAKFKVELDSHIDKVLAPEQVKQMLEEHEGDLVIAPINGSEIFENLYQTISMNYNDAVLAVRHLKAVFEANTSTSMPPQMSGIAPPVVQSSMKCCCSFDPGNFNEKVRDNVHDEECYGNQDKVLEHISRTRFKDAMKENDQNYATIAWQYFADSDGHYIQYPANDRSCDKLAPPLPGVCDTVDSPLHEKWYAEKLNMQHKNLIILVDNSLSESLPEAVRVMKDAVYQALDTLTPNDEVNIVTFDRNMGAEVPTGCDDNLFVATTANIYILKQYVQHITPVAGETKLLASLQKAYELLEGDRNTTAKVGWRKNLILMLLQGQSHLHADDELSLLHMIAKHQQMLVPKAQHFMYMLGKPSDEDLPKLMQVVDQNNMKLKDINGTSVAAWPQSRQPVGPEGILTLIEDSFTFASQVGLYFQHLPPSPNVDHDLTTIVPVLDEKYGLGLTVVAPVSDSNKTVGVVAVDASLATVFSDLINLHVGVNSYSYIVDNNHGNVLLHPKLRDPSETWNGQNIFPRLELLEPHLTLEQRSRILNAASSRLLNFEAQVNDLHPEISGELVTSRDVNLSSATIYCQRIAGTSLVAVLVIFKSDVEEPKFRRPVEKISLHGIYHRIDKLLGAPGLPGKEAFCHLYGDHFLSFKQSVIKFAPDLFTDPEVYKYSEESVEMASQLNIYITSGVKTKYIKSSMHDLILHTLEATDTLDMLWTNHSKDVIERFYGSSDGVFRIYPGSPMMSTFDHRDTDWYKRSTAFPSMTMYHLGQLGFLQQGDVIIISRAVTSTIGVKRLQGVVGLTVTPRFLTSQLVDSTAMCADQWCHILDTSGQILDTLGNSTGTHVTSLYPWLAKKLAGGGKLQQEWCTGFSDGFHKMTFTLTQNVTSDLDNSDPCLQFSLHEISDTNLFILVLEDRNKLKCDDHQKQICTSCQTPVDDSDVSDLSLPQCQYCLSNMTSSTCQCPCYCDTDFDQCQGQFMTDLKDFPSTNCFYPPSFTTKFIPEPPGPIHHLDRCPIPCVAIEDLGICRQLEHCKLSVNKYPTCIWKTDVELKNISDVSRFFPTTSQPHPPTPPRLTKTAAVPAMLTDHFSSTSGEVMPTKGPAPTEHALTLSQSSPASPSTTVNSPVNPFSSGSGIHPSTASKVTDISTVTGSHPVTSTTQSFTDSTQDQAAKPTENTSNVPQVTTQSGSQKPGLPINTTPDMTTIAIDHSTEESFHHSTAKLTNNRPRSSESGMSGGAIAALVIGILVIVALFVFVGLKMYGKKFRRHASDAPSAKYRAGNTLFDSTVFLRNVDQVSSTSSAPSSTNVPYQEMER